MTYYYVLSYEFECVMARNLICNLYFTSPVMSVTASKLNWTVPLYWSWEIFMWHLLH